MNKEQFEAIINKVDFLKTDDNKIDYDIIITILENRFNDYETEQPLNQLLNAEYEVLKGGD